MKVKSTKAKLFFCTRSLRIKLINYHDYYLYFVLNIYWISKLSIANAGLIDLIALVSSAVTNSIKICSWSSDDKEVWVNRIKSTNRNGWTGNPSQICLHVIQGIYISSAQNESLLEIYLSARWRRNSFCDLFLFEIKEFGPKLCVSKLSSSK